MRTTLTTCSDSIQRPEAPRSEPRRRAANACDPRRTGGRRHRHGALTEPRRPAAARKPLALAVGLIALACAAAAEETAPQVKPTKFEGAVGLVATWGPEYAGARAHSLSLRPAGFVRYGRISISGAGGFTTRRNDDVERGLAASLVQRQNFKVSLALRYDHGRSESDSDRLDGMGDIDATLRARLLLRWMPDRNWTLSTAVSADVLNRGGGWFGDVSVSRGWSLSPDTRFSLGATLSYAGDTYLQTWYGVNAEQSALTGYPVYRPREGLRELNVGATLRSELGPHWAGFVSAGAGRELGPAADSPLVERPGGWSVGGGLVWRF